MYNFSLKKHIILTETQLFIRFHSMGTKPCFSLWENFLNFRTKFIKTGMQLIMVAENKHTSRYYSLSDMPTKFTWLSKPGHSGLICTSTSVLGRTGLHGISPSGKPLYGGEVVEDKLCTVIFFQMSFLWRRRHQEYIPTVFDSWAP